MYNIKSKHSIAIILITALLLSIGLIYMNQNFVNAEEDLAIQKQEEINTLIQNLEEFTRQDSMLSASSNPYDYTKNQYFDKITELGIDYLPYVIKKVEEDESLRSFLMTIAASRISKSSFTLEYSHSHEWLEGWKKYVETVPSLYEELKLNQDDTTDESESIVQLGAPVVPYIISDISNGDLRFTNVLSKLIEPDMLPKETAIDAWKSWAEENQSLYD